MYVIGASWAINRINDLIKTTHADSNDIGTYGLGQVAKVPRVGDLEYFDFLSKDVYMKTNGEHCITRKLDRVHNRDAAATFKHRIFITEDERNYFLATLCQ